MEFVKPMGRVLATPVGPEIVVREAQGINTDTSDTVKMCFCKQSNSRSTV